MFGSEDGMVTMQERNEYCQGQLWYENMNMFDCFQNKNNSYCHMIKDFQSRFLFKGTLVIMEARLSTKKQNWH